MQDDACVAFLQWALPRLQLRWAGFRKPRRQVCRRIERRREALGLADVGAYRRHLEAPPDEWAALERLCRITLSRFGRDRDVWAHLAGEVLPALARDALASGRTAVAAWSAGCGAGEEPYTLAIAWQEAVAPRLPGVALGVLATDADGGQLARARAGCYPRGPLRELPEAWRRAAFAIRAGLFCVTDPVKRAVRFAERDLRAPPPAGPFDLVLCRNLAFTYFEEPLQRAVAAALRSVLRPGGFLVVGIHERLPPGTPGFRLAGRCLWLAE